MDQTRNESGASGPNENRTRRGPNTATWIALAFVMYCLSPIPVGHLLNKLGASNAVWEVFICVIWLPLEWCYHHVPAVKSFYVWAHGVFRLLLP